MTFVLKDLSKLRELFNHAVTTYLKRESKGAIIDLNNPKRYQLQFLSAVLSKLEEQETETNSSYVSNAFHGAMLTIIQDIDSHRNFYEGGGLLRNFLADISANNAETKAEDKPDLYQIAKFHQALNSFLNQVFVNNDSRNGFKKEHLLAVIPTDNLSKLMEISYKQEKNAQKAIITSLVADGKSSCIANDFELNHKAPASATDRFVDFVTLNDAIDDLIRDELADKNVSKIEKLSQVRKTQLHFLNVIRETLKTATIQESDKVAILAGALHVVHKRIYDEYANAYVGNLDNSVIYKGLDKILGKDEVSAQDQEALIYSLHKFMHFMTIEKNEGKQSIRSKHIFSDIAGFDLKDTFNLQIDMICACRNTALKDAVGQFKKETKGVDKTPGGFLSSALGSLSLFTRGSTKDNESSDEEDLEHTAAANK